MYELIKDFRFEAAHTLGRSYGAETSARIHGHSYRAQIALRGEPDEASGMIMDTTAIEAALAETRALLDHQLLDTIADLGPGTLENLAHWIWRRLRTSLPALRRVTVFRDSTGEACSYWDETDRS